jgi:hypothetical protein
LQEFELCAKTETAIATSQEGWKEGRKKEKETKEVPPEWTFLRLVRNTFSLLRH